MSKQISVVAYGLLILVAYKNSVSVFAEEPEPPVDPAETFVWVHEGHKFFRCTLITVRTNFEDPKQAMILFDRNLVAFDDFGDRRTTLRGYRPVKCELTRIPKKDPVDRRLYRVTLPEKLAAELNNQEIRLACSAPDPKDKRVFLRLLMVNTPAEGNESVEQVANFRLVKPRTKNKTDKPTKN